MDLGLGPLADLVWAGLPGARPALAELALAELDGAILADRAPLALPGIAVAEVLSGFLREELDRAVQGWPGSARSIRRRARTLSRLLDVDAVLDGRHHGDVRSALRWLGDQPYRAVLAEADLTVLARL